MGIDAEILIRLKQAEKPTDEQVARWSWALASAVGANKFFMTDGIPQEQYEVASAAWFEAFKAHPLHEQYKAGNRDAHAKILADIGDAPQELRRALRLSRTYGDDDGHRPEPGKAHFQDGPVLYADDGEWFLEVSLWTRYYGVGYERGDLMTICAAAEWIEANMPNAAVWYGGDSSGVLMEPFGRKQREALKKHFYSQSGKAYFGTFSRGESFPHPKPCGLCIPGEPRFNRHGWGADYVAVNCGGCGKSFESRDNGATWTVEKNT